MPKQVSLLKFFEKIPSPKLQNQRKNVNQNGDEKNLERKEELNVCDLVWAKLDGHPWWPGLICQHPHRKEHLRGDEAHVQFFDNPPTRAWVKKSKIEKYSLESDKRNPKGCSESDLKNLKQACEEADKAYHLKLPDRSNLLIDFNNASFSEEDSITVESSPENNKENESEDGEIDEFSPKRRKKIPQIIFDSDDSEDEYKPEEEDDDDDETSGDDSVCEEEREESVKKGIKRKRNHSLTSSRKKQCPTPTTSGRNSHQEPSAKARLSLFKNQPCALSKGQEEEKSDDWPHLRLEFLQPDKIMDKHKRRPGHPDYDKRTLYVPEEFKNKVTPAMRQWWELKADYFDSVICFKVGKFYEFFHMDAVIGVNELSLTFMKGDFAHSGFPEISYGRFSQILIQKGYKVARVEQTETPEMMTERCKQMRLSKFDKVVRREICQVTTKGTQIFSFIDGGAKEAETNYLFAIGEKFVSPDNIIFGVCFIDTSIGVFHIGQFHDDKFLSRLRTLLSHYPPVQILYERCNMSTKTLSFLNNSFPSVLKEPLAAETEFWSAEKTLSTLSEENHFTDPDRGGTVWPDALNKFISPADHLDSSSSVEGEVAIKAFGACVWYLKKCYLDQQLLAMKKFEVYTPVDSPTRLNGISAKEKVDLGRYMVLDGLALTNLEVLTNSSNPGEISGTLMEKLDTCSTFAGKRLMRQWLCNPLCSIPAIKSRQEAISEFIQNSSVVGKARLILKNVPDMERLLGKIHTQGNALRSKTHPDSRAIFFEDKVYSKRKIQDLLFALAGFENIQKAVETLREETWKSSLLQQCILEYPEGEFRNLTEHLTFFKNAFDHDLAKKEGCIIPRSSGVDPEYDAVIEEIKSIEKELAVYLKSQCQYFGTAVKYFGSDKNRFQLEVPDNVAKKADSNYEFSSCRKGFKRFTTAKTKEFLRRQRQAEETKLNILKDLSRRVFAQFSDKYEDWMAAIRCSSLLDVLMSFVDYCEKADVCIPEFVPPTPNERPFIDIRNGRHPCLHLLNEEFVPNDIKLGADSFNNFILLTGPNMGGKSTLMRQLGLTVIMAQVGLSVPADSCKLVPVDRVFTRIGAKDDILAGESTFYVELSEASLILNSATQYSLVLMDELGRGTSTYDGTAIAYAVVRELYERNCRTLFSTHYHTLVNDFKNSSAVTLGHMACAEEADEDDPSEKSVTFLYKFISGSCPKSYGFNAAKLAGVPSAIVKSAREKTAALEKEAEKRKLFKKICSLEQCSSEDLEQLFNSV